MYRERQKGIKKLCSEFLHELKLSLSHVFGGVLGRWLIKHLLFPRPLRERARVRGYITRAGCEVIPAQKVIAILQGQIDKEVQNDKTNFPLLAGQGEVLIKEHLFPLLTGEGKGEVANPCFLSHVVVKRSVLKKEHLFPRPLRERVRVRGYITRAGCHVQPAQKVIAILQGQIDKEVQNDKTNFPLLAGQGEGEVANPCFHSHVVVKRSVLKKEHLFPRPLRERARVRGYITSAGCEVIPDKKTVPLLPPRRCVCR